MRGGLALTALHYKIVAMAPKTSVAPMAIAVGIAIGLILSLAFLPLAPRLTIGINISNSQGLQIASLNYAKVPLGSIAGLKYGNIALSLLGVILDSFALNVTISYQNVTLSHSSFRNLGSGGYQLQVIYFPRSEDTSVPYLIQFWLYSGGSLIAAPAVTIYPR